MKTNRKLIIFIVAIFLFFGFITFLKFSPLGSSFFWKISNGGKWLLPFVFISSLIDSVNPCAFSILIITVAFLASLGKNRAHILKIGSVYILGIFVVYILIGLSILKALYLFNMSHFMAKVGAVLMISLGGISLINKYFPSFPIKLVALPHIHGKIAWLLEKSSIPAVFILGGLVGLFEFPCTGGAYLMILGLLYDKITYLNGIGYLLFYNIIFILPLIIILLIASNKSLLEKIQQWKKEKVHDIHFYGGIIMIAFGILIFML